MKYIFVIIERKEEEKSVLQIAKPLQLFYLKRTGIPFRERYEFLHQMDCTGPFNGIDKELLCVYLRWSTTYETDLSTRQDEDRELFTCEWLGLEKVSTVRGVVHVVRGWNTVKPFCNALSQPYLRFYLNKNETN